MEHFSDALALRFLFGGALLLLLLLLWCASVEGGAANWRHDVVGRRRDGARFVLLRLGAVSRLAAVATLLAARTFRYALFEIH